MQLVVCIKSHKKSKIKTRIEGQDLLYLAVGQILVGTEFSSVSTMKTTSPFLRSVS